MSRYSMDTVKARPLNCSPALGDKERCPYCGQFHLRPGYCQALDPINAEKYPGIWDGTIAVDRARLRETANVDNVDVSTSPPGGETALVHSTQDADEARKAYKREWMRRKRQEERGE